MSQSHNGKSQDSYYITEGKPLFERQFVVIVYVEKFIIPFLKIVSSYIE